MVRARARARPASRVGARRALASPNAFTGTSTTQPVRRGQAHRRCGHGASVRRAGLGHRYQAVGWAHARQGRGHRRGLVGHDRGRGGRALGADGVVGPPSRAGRGHRPAPTRTPTTCPGVVLPDASAGHRLARRGGGRRPPSSSWPCPPTAFAPCSPSWPASLPAGTPVLSAGEGARAGHPSAHDRGHRPGASRATPPGCSPGRTWPARWRPVSPPPPWWPWPTSPWPRQSRSCCAPRRSGCTPTPTWSGARWPGATKNVLAIAAGILQGLGLGDSSLAALITRGLAELGTARRGHGGRAHHHRRPGRGGRPGGHLHQLAEPEPDGGGAARPGPLPRRRSWPRCAWWPRA